MERQTPIKKHRPSKRCAALRRHLDEELQRYACGQKMPSVRALLRKYRVGRESLDGVLAEMEGEGLIRRVPQVGIFCSRSDPERRKLVTLAVPDFPLGDVNPFHLSLVRAFEASGRFQFQRVCVREPYYRNLAEQIGDILLLGIPSYELTPEHFRQVSELAVPAVFLGRNFHDFGLHFSDTLPGFGGVLAAEHLLQNGHRDLAVLISEPPCPEVMNRVSSFACFAESHGAAVRIIDCHTRAYESCQAHAYDAMSEYLSRKACDFTGLFVISDTSAPGALRALHDFGLSVPDDVSVVGYDGLPQGEYYFPPLTTVAENFALHAQRLVEAVGGYFDGRNPLIRIEAPPFLLRRRSVRTVVPAPAGMQRAGNS